MACRYCNDTGYYTVLVGGLVGKPETRRVPCSHPRSMAEVRARLQKADAERRCVPESPQAPCTTRHPGEGWDAPRQEKVDG